MSIVLVGLGLQLPEPARNVLVYREEPVESLSLNIYVDHFHVSLAHAHAHAHSSMFKATTQQHAIQLVGELAPCAGCSMANGICASTPHHTTSRAAAPINMVHTHTTGPYQESLGGSRYVVMFVDSASRLQHPYGAQGKSAYTIIDVVKRFVVDMVVPRAFRTANGAEYTSSTFVDYCNGPIYASSKRPRGEWILKGHQRRTRGTT